MTAIHKDYANMQRTVNAHLQQSFGNGVLEVTISEPLKKAIQNSGMSANQIAKAVGLPQSTITRFLQGTDMRTSAADKIAAYFGLTLTKELPAKPKSGKSAKK